MENSLERPVFQKFPVLGRLKARLLSLPDHILDGSERGDRPNISRFSREYHVSRKTIIRDIRELIHRGQLDATLAPETEPDAP